MKKIILLIWFCAISLTLNAANIIDVYGVDLKESEDIIKNYGTQVGNIESQLMAEFIKISNGGKDHYAKKVLLPKKLQLINKIQKKYNFSYVDFDTIFYPNDKDTHTTIEVITSKDRSRLRFIPSKNKISTTPELNMILLKK